VKVDLVTALLPFGLSVNQAKVYLSIVQSTEARINIISADTKIHQQDVYKILPKLEEMGLIVRTVERPVTIRAIPPGKALNELIAAEEQKANRKIRQLKQSFKNLAEAIEEKQTNQDQSEIQAIFLVTDKTINNRFDTAFENATKQCDGVFNFKLMQRRLPLVEKRYQALATHNVQARILIDNVENVENAQRILKQAIPHSGDFTIRQNEKVTVKPYLVIDNKEIFITSQKKTARNFPCILWTNSKNIIEIYKDNFEKAWKRSKPIIICE
jgi:sugar-specific transcriptional regulator TrmB